MQRLPPSYGTQALEHARPVVAVQGFLVVKLGLRGPVVGGIIVPRPGIEPMSHALEGGF